MKEPLYDPRADDRQNDGPTKTWECRNCGSTVERYRGEDDVRCSCGIWYNAFGQRLRDDWYRNPSNWDESISDLEGELIVALDDAMRGQI